MTPDLPTEAVAQLRLRYRLAAAAGDGYFEAGFAVALEDVIAGPMLPELLALVRSRPRHSVVLVPTPGVILARDAARRSSGYRDWSVEQLHQAFVGDTPRIGLWLDTSNQTPQESVDEILARTGAASDR
jgi:chloramphenicol 3-O-phosphotransferase